MQTIERYGVVALLFLIVTVLAVIIWDGEPAEKTTARARAAERHAAARRAAPETPRSPKRAEPAPEALAGSPAESTEAAPRVELRLKPVARPLSRDRVEEPAAGLRVARETTAGDREPPRRAAPPDDEPEPAAARAVQGAPRERIYVVRASDTLSEISQAELGTSKRWREILLLNPGLDPARLAVGQEIRLPAGDAPVPGRGATGATEARPTPAATTSRGTPVAAAAPAKAPKVPAGPTYRVRAGDSLWKIAAQHLGDGERWREIAALNPKVDPNRLIVGRELVLPSAATVRKEPLVASNTGTRARGRVR